MKRDSITVVHFIFCITTILLLSGNILNAEGVEIHVPGDYSTIQDAIDHAVDEDIIIIAEGTYSENINFNGKGITVKSTDPNNSAIVENTIISGGTNGNCIVNFNNGEESRSILCGVSVRNGTDIIGTGICCYSSSPSIIKCIIKENRAASIFHYGAVGGGICCMNSSPKIINCDIIDNSSSKASGGGIYLSNSSPIISKCRISGNSAYAEGAGCASNWLMGGYIEITNAGSGGGIYCINSSPIITNCRISKNSATGSVYSVLIYPDFGPPLPCHGSGIGSGGGIYCINSSPTITNCIIIENLALGRTTSNIFGSIPISCGSAKGYGGGIYFINSSSTITNCTIIKNSAEYHAFHFCLGEREQKGHEIYSDNSSSLIKNSIFLKGIYIDSKSSASVTYSFIPGYSGEGNLPIWEEEGDEDEVIPLFVDPNIGDYHLHPSSPCINAGTSEGAPKSDIDNNPRPIGSGYDMGAYEFLECSLNSLITVYKDGDGDNYGDPNIVAFVCNGLSGYVENKEDCNDNDPNINPVAIEICDDKDNNCNGKIDDGLSVYIYYSDTDGDGYGDPNNTIERCYQPIGYLLDNTDCMDNDPLINPGAIESCDGIDKNCDDKVNVEGSQGCTIYYKDEDHDEQGVDIDSRCLCSPDDSNKYTAIYSGDPDDSDPNTLGTILTGNMSLPAAWSMVSIPLTQDNASVSSMFPDAVVVYGYETGKGYVRVKKEENMEEGVGYWILLNETKTYSMTGEIIDDYNLSVQDGWYMIGGCTYPAQALEDNCNICIIYGYEQESGYQQVLGAEDLEPGNGYWILFENVTGQANLTVQEIME